MATSQEFLTGSEVRTGFIKGNSFGYRAVQYYVIDGLMALSISRLPPAFPMLHV